MSNVHETSTGEIPKAKTKQIWKVFWILLGLTALEFVIAFVFPPSMWRVGVFVILTIVKAFYIVAEFMHLGHEVKFLAWSIILPMIFVAWFILAMMVEGESVFTLRL
ncbi:cytochrome C oxidase subunit IV family protein [Microscilla marina]|uniref:cytochrome C oxidase subunit IV family protein n=1 Tax=Microscilla marina TaxID=1027 RepID=UPI0005D47AB3|nr:cytochrome C oxidase subunit IV family protein [Microscilla marina]